MNKIFLLLFFFFISCQPVEVFKPIAFDNKQLEKLSITASYVEINVKYESPFVEPFIDHSLDKPPILRIKSWLNENILSIGDENKLIINILDASIRRNEIKNKDAKNYEENFVYKYELFYLVEYTLYDNSNYILASTLVESYRSTTSSKFISIQESEIIIDDLILQSLQDFAKESVKLISKYMQDYVL